MGIIEDILKALDRIPGWARIQQLPTEVDELKQKIASLEELLSNKHAPDFCRFCGAREVRLYHVFPGLDAKGNVREEWKCGACDHNDTRYYKPSAR
jgi:hypothetical protein